MADLCMIIWVVNVLSKLQCGFRKGFGAHNYLLYMIQTIVKTRDNHRVLAAVLTDLPNAFDSISHEHLIGKLNAWWNFIKSDYLISEKSYAN